jgi:hypothetical protein
MDLLCNIGHVESRFNPFGDSGTVSVRRCTVCAKRTIGSKNVWMHQMVLLGDEAQVDAHLGLFGDSANLDARQVHGLCRMHYRLRNRSGRTQWISSVTLACGILYQSIWRHC